MKKYMRLYNCLFLLIFSVHIITNLSIRFKMNAAGEQEGRTTKRELISNSNEFKTIHISNNV